MGRVEAGGSEGGIGGCGIGRWRNRSRQGVGRKGKRSDDETGRGRELHGERRFVRDSKMMVRSFESRSILEDAGSSDNESDRKVG